MSSSSPAAGDVPAGEPRTTSAVAPGVGVAPPPADVAASVDAELRAELRVIADRMIPAAHGMPAASEVGATDAQLDRVLRARPDLVEPLLRTRGRLAGPDGLEALGRLEQDDPAAHDAVLLAVVGAYYTDRDVRRRLGYTGQEPVEVRPQVIPDYVEEGLLDPLLERGPAYRSVPGAE